MMLSFAILAFVALLGYWWAAEGALSAVMHFICVVCAGALALAAWEPVVTGLLLRGNGFDDYAWGAGLAISFALILVLLRVACDRLVPGNLNLPRAANVVIGAAFGLASGILTSGILLIAIGFTQSHIEIVGYRGQTRQSVQDGSIEKLWIPVASITQRFYSTLSRTAFSPPRSNQALAVAAPGLSDMALSYHRDGFLDGMTKTSVAPSAVSVTSVWRDESFRGNPSWGVVVSFQSQAFDNGSSLTLSSSQARLMFPDASPRARGLFPSAFGQPNAEGGKSIFMFDDVGNYASTVSGQQECSILLIFQDPGEQLGQPKFIEIKGTRFALPGSISSPDGGLASAYGAGGEIDTRLTEDQLAKLELAPALSEAELKIDNTLGITLSKNEVTGAIRVVSDADGNYLADGEAEFSTGANRSVQKGLRVDRFLSKPKTRMVKLDITRGAGLIDVETARKRLRDAAPNTPLTLVDSLGTRYFPVGYIQRGPKVVKFKLDPVGYLKTLGQIPVQSSSAGNSLILLFDITEGVTIRGVMIGEDFVGQSNLLVDSL